MNVKDEKEQVQRLVGRLARDGKLQAAFLTDGDTVAASLGLQLNKVQLEHVRAAVQSLRNQANDPDTERLIATLVAANSACVTPL